MARDRTNRPLGEELPRLLAQRGMSLRALAREADTDVGFLSRALRRADSKRPSAELVRRIESALELPAGYFPEGREALVVEEVRSRPRLRDELYDRLAQRKRKR